MNSTINPADIKLIVFDLDGTLLGPSKRFTPYTKTILSRLRAKGIPFTLASGRNLPAIQPFADEIKVNLPLILSNGSILQTRQGKLFAQTCLPEDVVRTSIDVSRSLGRDMVLNVCDRFYIERMNDNLHTTYSWLKNSLCEIERWENITDKFSSVSKCAFVDNTDEQNLITTQPILQEALDGRAIALRTSPVLLEVQPKGITKATGLHRLAKHLSIPLEAVIAFGDYDNDAEMLREAGFGIAVGDATPACLENADLLVASPEVDGPAHFLEELFLV